MWFGTYKNSCMVRTLRSLISNMFTGVHEVSLQPLPLSVDRGVFLLAKLIY